MSNIGGFTFKDVAEHNKEKVKRLAGIKGLFSKRVSHLINGSDKLINLFGNALDNFSWCEHRFNTAIGFAKSPTLASHGKFELAIKALNDVIEECKTSEFVDDAINHSARFYFLSGDYENAIAAYKRLAEEYPDSPFNENNLSVNEASFLEECKQDAENMESYREAMLYEFENNRDWAINYFKKSEKSECNNLRQRSNKKIVELGRQ